MPRRVSKMPKHIVSELSPEQEILLPKYIEKWQAIATLTQAIDREKVEAVIRNAYRASDFPEPEIIFFSNPFAAIKEILGTKNFNTYLGKDISSKFKQRVFTHLYHLIERQIDKPLFYKLMNQINYPGYPNHFDQYNNPKAFHFPMGIQNCVKIQIIKDLDRADSNYLDLKYSEILKLLDGLIIPTNWSNSASMFDFCISVLGLEHDQKKWEVIQELMQYCGFIFLFENVCIACDRPYKLSFDQQNSLHAEGKYALEFIDGYGVYAYHGGEPPEGKRCKNNEYIEPGTRVKLLHTGEYGIVVHCWYSDEISDFDCYVAFFGTSFPDRETHCRPYIFRYAAVSLEILE